MPIFEYKAKTKTGRNYQGTMFAKDSAEVAKFIQTHYGFVTAIQQQSSRINFLQIKSAYADLANFCQKLSVFLRVGIPLLKAVDLLNQQLGKDYEKALQEITNKLSEGASFAECLSRHSRIFPKLLIGIVEVGEASGKLDKVLQEIAHYYWSQNKIINYLMNICIYPLLILSLLLVMSLVFILKVIPQFLELYQSLQVPQGLFLQMLAFIHDSIFLILLSVVFLAICFAWQLRKKIRNKKFFLEELIFSLPFLQTLERQAEEARFCTIMSLLLDAGVSISTTLKVIINSMSNKKFQQRLVSVSEQISLGVPINVALQGANSFLSITTLEFIRIGDEGGRLVEMFLLATQQVDEDLQNTTKRIKVLLEPVMIIFVAFFFAIIIVSLFYPLFSLIEDMEVSF